ncbi:MAG: hypothetical protein O8C61_03410 [Candidatus Methanoperedens sp.]|nr:hypothetical protein [Candidatus Methanoperedens sp.]
MLNYIGELLKELNTKSPDYVTLGELRKSINVLDGTIHEARRKDLIVVYPKSKSGINNQDKITINIKGIELLNQILITKTLEELNNSVQNFKTSNIESSKNIETAISNLNNSIQKFNESSDKYSIVNIFLAMVLVFFTIVLIRLTPDTPNFPDWLKIIIMGLLVVIAFFCVLFFSYGKTILLLFRSKKRKLSELVKKELDDNINLVLLFFVSYFAISIFYGLF